MPSQRHKMKSQDLTNWSSPWRKKFWINNGYMRILRRNCQKKLKNCKFKLSTFKKINLTRRIGKWGSVQRGPPWRLKFPHSGSNMRMRCKEQIQHSQRYEDWKTFCIRGWRRLMSYDISSALIDWLMRSMKPCRGRWPQCTTKSMICSRRDWSWIMKKLIMKRLLWDYKMKYNRRIWKFNKFTSWWTNADQSKMP